MGQGPRTQVAEHLSSRWMQLFLSSSPRWLCVGRAVLFPERLVGTAASCTQVDSQSASTGEQRKRHGYHTWALQGLQKGG